MYVDVWLRLSDLNKETTYLLTYVDNLNTTPLDMYSHVQF